MKTMHLVGSGLMCAALVVACSSGGTITSNNGTPQAQPDSALPIVPAAPDSSAAADASVDPQQPQDAASPGDTALPVVSLVLSALSVTAEGDITIVARATDNIGVAKLDLYLDGQLGRTSATGEISVALRLTSAENGAHTLYAVATDAAGNTATTPTQTLNVNIPAASPLPSFVGVGTEAFGAAVTALDVASPTADIAGDLELAIVGVDEGTGPRTIAAPAGWRVVAGYPIHNLSTDHSPYIIPTSESHGAWIFYRIVSAGSAATTTFNVSASTAARAVVISYRNVDPARPINDINGFAYYSSGDTNGLMGGNTTLDRGLVVHLVATSATAGITYSRINDSYVTERFNSGEANNGLNLFVADKPFDSRMYFGMSFLNRQGPSGSAKGTMMIPTSLTLRPR